MKIVEALMKPGTWDMTLRPDTPREVLDQIRDNLFTYDSANNRYTSKMQARVVVFDTRGVDPQVSGFTGARYTGRILWNAGIVGFGGDGLAGYLANREGVGVHWGFDDDNSDAFNSAFTTDGTLDDWFDELITNTTGSFLTDANGLTKGTVTDTSSYVGGPVPASSVFEQLDYVCAQLDSEWRVNPDGSIDAGADSDLFITTPTVLVTPTENETVSGSVRGVDGEIVSHLVTCEHITSDVYVAAQGFGEPMGVGAGATAKGTLGRGIDGSVARFVRWTNTPGETTANAQQLAGRIINLYDQPHATYQLRTFDPHVRRYTEPGDSVYVYFPEAKISGGAAVEFAGETVTPQTVRVTSIGWQPGNGHGVWLHVHDGTTETWTDLSDYVEHPDQPQADWTVDTLAAQARRAYVTWVARLGRNTTTNPQIWVEGRLRGRSRRRSIYGPRA